MMIIIIKSLSLDKPAQDRIYLLVSWYSILYLSTRPTISESHLARNACIGVHCSSSSCTNKTHTRGHNFAHRRSTEAAADEQEEDGEQLQQHKVLTPACCQS